MKTGKIMKREVLSFDYVDSKGKVSHRALIPFTKPSDTFFGIDIGQEDVSLVLNYLDARDALEADYKKKLKQLDEEFLNPAFRSFKATSMANVVSTKF
jgi:hypothetical protein